MRPLGAALALLAALCAAGPAHADTSHLTLRVISARTAGGHAQGAPVGTYRWLINEDNSANPLDPVAECRPATNAAFPAGCEWPSIQTLQGWSPIVTQGDQGDLNATTGIDLPPGRYLISVLGEDHKIDGVHFSVPLPDPGLVTVAAQPYPLPLATLRVQVYADNAPTNGQWDVPAEDGLRGFRAHLRDVLDEVSTDWFGNPLCTVYRRNGAGQIIFDADGSPVVNTNVDNDGCISGPDGIIEIPNLGPNRYAVTVIPPDGTDWVRTTTLEGGHDWDTWLGEGATGNDTEFVNAGEPTPFTEAGFVRPERFPVRASVTGQIKGRVLRGVVYIPQVGGVAYNGTSFPGGAGTQTDGPVKRPWIALSDLDGGDQKVYTARGNKDGTFVIRNVPDSSYAVTIWDDEQDYLLDTYAVTVRRGQVVDMGQPILVSWFTRIEGHVFVDSNENGKRDPGERGVPGMSVVVKTRGNTLQDQGSNLATSDFGGHYQLRETYPLGQFLVLEAYSDRYRTTGVTYQASNQPTETTLLGAGVDLSMLDIMGQSGRVDWGVMPYAKGTNGGIVGSVTYDTTRNELKPEESAVEDWQPGIPGLEVRLWRAVPDPNDEEGYLKNADGSFVRAGNDVNGTPDDYTDDQPLQTYTTETWQRPKGCTARDVDGNPVVDQLALPVFADPTRECVEAPMTGVQFGGDEPADSTVEEPNYFSSVNGNYGFGDIEPGDYLVQVVIPNDPVLGRPLLKPTREEDINVFDGDQFEPRIYFQPCAGATHVVDVAGIGPDGPGAIENPAFADEGGSPYEGDVTPLCDVKLVKLRDRRSVAPGFTFFTDVPVPTHFWGYVIDDLNVSVDPKTTFFGEKAGIANSPVGFYDFTNRLVYTQQTDPNGMIDVLLPSSDSINCPTPSGVCPNVYRMVGNDPGGEASRNPTYNPLFRTISATFQGYPGVLHPVDVAPTQVGVTILNPGSTVMTPVQCKLADTTPELYAIDVPFADFRTTPTTPSPPAPAGDRTLRIRGKAFVPGTVVYLNETAMPTTVVSSTELTFTVPRTAAPVLASGQYQLSIRNPGGAHTVNGLTFHVLRNGGIATAIRQVGPGRTYATIQAALQASASSLTNRDLVVVYPGAPATFNPEGAYFENIVVHSPLWLQGVGPGGTYPDGTGVRGSVIDGSTFQADADNATAWRNLVAGLTYAGQQNPFEGETIFVVGNQIEYSLAPSRIDGLEIQGGDLAGFAANVDLPGADPPAPVDSQGGGIFLNAYIRNMQITNNVLRGNAGAYGGAIRVGTPNLGANADEQNDSVRIAYNRILANGGSNLAGAIGLFQGTQNYRVDHNDLCGNFSAEYGGGISHYGFSSGGRIDHNRVYFDRSYDEGGGVFVAGELPENPNTLSRGSGAVDIEDNLIQANLANDDGGGIRLLMVNNAAVNIRNNIIANNVSTHDGGGIALDDAANVRIVSNTIMKNITTATAVDSDGLPAPAGVAAVRNSDQLQNSLPGRPAYSLPVLFENVFWDNRAGSAFPGGVAGIGVIPGETISRWDLGVSDNPTGVLMAPRNSVIQQLPTDAGRPYTDHPSNRHTDPGVIAPYDTSVAVFPWRYNPRFVGAQIVAVEQPVELMGNYRLPAASPAIDIGPASFGTGTALNHDIDDQPRPFFTSAPTTLRYDAGADEWRP